MFWLIALAVVIAVAGYAALRAEDRKKNEQNLQDPAAQPVRPARTSERNTPKPMQPLGNEPATPITTQKAACQLLSSILASRKARPLSGATADLALEMKEHAEELRSNIEFLREEVRSKKEYRAVIAENLQDQLDEHADGLDPDEEGTARTNRHLGHLDREIAEMQEALSKQQGALKAFRADRTAFVHSFAAHLLDGTPSPNIARNPDASS